MSTEEETIHRRVLNSVALMLPDLALNVTPPEIAQQVYRIVYEITRNKDPYLEAKRCANIFFLLMDGDLGKFDDLYEVAEAFNKNVKRSFWMILIPNTLCIALAFFRLAGLPASLVLNNGFNLLSAINGMLPYIRSSSINDPIKVNPNVGVK